MHLTAEVSGIGQEANYKVKQQDAPNCDSGKGSIGFLPDCYVSIKPSKTYMFRLGTTMPGEKQNISQPNGENE